MRAQTVHAVIIASHMGLRRGGDNFANRTESLIQEFPEIAAFIGGHIHQHVSNQSVNGVPFTQANYFGIHMGRLDLTFNKETRELLWAQPMTTETVAPCTSATATPSRSIRTTPNRPGNATWRRARYCAAPTAI